MEARPVEVVGELALELAHEARQQAMHACRGGHFQSL
jgi:hypothetical protein